MTLWLKIKTPSSTSFYLQHSQGNCPEMLLCTHAGPGSICEEANNNEIISV
jgi:hypothetical protein